MSPLTALDEVMESEISDTLSQHLIRRSTISRIRKSKSCVLFLGTLYVKSGDLHKTNVTLHWAQYWQVGSRENVFWNLDY